MKALDIPAFALDRSALIEASAGTGKTFTIAHLYLRLLLGHQCDARTVDQILVVTFTNAATAELKDRIRQLIMQAVQALFASETDGVLGEILSDVEDKSLACQRLILAARQLDEASIYTIHGFCQRMLVQHAFESGSAYQQQLITDESELLQHAANDFWRRHISPTDKDSLTQILAIWATPAELTKTIGPLLSRAITLEAPLTTASQVRGTLEDVVSQLKRWWLDKRLPEHFAKADFKKGRKLARPELIEAFTAYCQSDALLPDGELGFEQLQSAKVYEAEKKASKVLTSLDFSLVDEALHLHQQWLQGLKAELLEKAVAEVRDQLRRDKRRQALLSPDDLLSQLGEALISEQGEALAAAIREQYPKAMIDEFQDTDPVQFEIFRRIYPADNHQNSLILIGDPKQAIYGFRGADIYTYIEAKHWVDAAQHYTLDSNWRSRPSLVEGVNRLFSQSQYGFLFDKDIPFSPVKAKNRQHWLEIDGQRSEGMTFWHWQTASASTFRAMAPTVAQQCANTLAGLLNQAQTGQTAIVDASGQRSPLTPGDCCVLVNNRNEAQVLAQTFKRVGIDSVFLSRESVFDTPLALELFYLLQALAHPSDEQAVKAALLTELVGLSASEFEHWLSHDQRWQQLLWEFGRWHRVWRQQGIASALNQALDFLSAFERQMARPDGVRRITDLRHLSELLQQQSQQLEGESQLLRWYQHRLQAPEAQDNVQQLRLETDANLVQIVTVHSSKGLEYPVVFYPFSCNSQPLREAFYHDATGQLKLAGNDEPEGVKQAEYEQLAEQLRLLYVALTRAALACFVGVWNPAHRGKQSVLKQVAVGKLVLKDGDEPDDACLSQRFTELADGDTLHYLPLELDPEAEPTYYRAYSDEQQGLACAQLSRSLMRQWRVTSYSALSQTQVADEPDSQEEAPVPGLDEGRDKVLSTPETESVTPFSFQRGAQAGSFLHDILEHSLPLSEPGRIRDVVLKMAKKYAILPTKWLSQIEEGADTLSPEAAEVESQVGMLCHWIMSVMRHPVGALDNVSLSEIGQLKAEMEFYLPLEQVGASQFNRVLNQHEPMLNANYQFERLSGMLKGYIDLTVVHEGRCFVADYKSNYLGDTLADYQGEALHEAMLEHDYYLQAILYVLALHRWLKVYWPGYDFDTHMGGSLYLFLRGMDGQTKDSGVLHYQPPKALILALDDLFDGQTPQVEQLSLC
ncbi:Exodeoxyribonuclease V [Saliniradius amylolyticus]|uniref:RecBCD enzyme subunit RecB n=1 Tax=Saliniradius amylolyticus TaxID=2183582 RepID=A0A2S2E1W9_9ALTE|nr:exodeoxyribonuclease V subunit beta [Saliniradius amylolyticus]AWL11634.1 Exodeoxyribonuclease V [Saliniradius amylolyticus]